ncbi:MAG: hypothetical protein IJJ00_03655, partial [Erysipelotrichaceae bacterium]|nr:hypothetical protein [Erysipelotrichaceae bacterium]
MKRPLLKKALALMFVFFMSASQLTTNIVRAEALTWKKVDSITDIAAGDKVAITMTTANGTIYALPSNQTSGPSATIVTTNADGDLVIDDASNDYEWTITPANGKYTIKNSSGKYLYITATNNGVKVGSTSCEWILSGNYLSATDPNNETRYLGVYLSSSPNWRCYKTNTGNSNIANQKVDFWVLQESGPVVPETYTVTVTHPEHGTISVDKEGIEQDGQTVITVQKDEQIVVTVTPDEDYVLDKLLVNNENTAVDEEGKVTITVVQNLSITATFKVVGGQEPLTEGLITDISQLVDGAHVVIYHPSTTANKKLALSSENAYNEWYMTGKAVTIEDDKVINPAEDLIWE